MPAEVLIALIGGIALVVVAAVNKVGFKADRVQKALSEKAAEEHRQFDEIKAVADMRAADAIAARDERDEARGDARLAREEKRLCEEDKRRLTSDLMGLAMIVRDEIAKEATTTAYAMEQAEIDESESHPPKEHP